MENKEHTNQNPDLDQDPVQEENSSPDKLEETTTKTPEIIPEPNDSNGEQPTPPEAAVSEAPAALIEPTPPVDESTPIDIPVEDSAIEATITDDAIEVKAEPEVKAEAEVEADAVAEPEKKEAVKEKKEKKTKTKTKKEKEEENVEGEKEEGKEEGKEEEKKDKKATKKATKKAEVKEPEEKKEKEKQAKVVAEDIVDDVKHDNSEEGLNQYTQEQLLDLLEIAVAEPDLNAVKTRVAQIKMAFVKKRDEREEPSEPVDTSEPVEPVVQEEPIIQEEPSEQEKETDGAPKKQPTQAELNSRFDALFSIYKANKGRYIAEQEKLKKENLEKKNKILDALRNLINSEEALKKTYDEFKVLQDQWKEVGMVPRNEINNLWQNYHFLVEMFFEKVKLNKELKDLDLKKNLEAKIKLCEKTEELLLESSVLKTFKQLQKYHDDWKEIGPAPTDKKDEIWERFKNATDKINERRRDYYASLEEEQTNNLETKNALCQQAEEVLTFRNETVKEWQDNTHKVNELLNIWKSVGPVPQKHNAEIWARFKGSLDAFFSSKKEFFDKVKDQQMHNYNLKVDLCVQAEAIKGSTDWKKTTNDLIHLQGEWKRVGPVPRKHSDRIWKRFRSACDEFFKTKSAYFANIHTHEDENMKAKEELLNKLKDHQFSENKSKNLDDLKGFQREWTQIGHVPFKERDRLQNEFRKLVNQHLDKLKISELEMTAVSYQTKMESMKSDPQGRRMITRERETLTVKISKLRDDINLWENNIGFLANSKNANILRVEFEKKIEKAKSDLKVMEAKFKILRQQ